MRQTPERRQKPNLAERTAEHWRPPLFTPAVTARQQFVAALRRFFDLQAGSIWNDMTEHLPFASGTVLDVGCGAQPYRALLPPTVAYCGIDTEEAEANFGYTIPDTLYFSGDSWPIADASIHLVFATETLEHVLDPARFLAEAFRCLRPSGRLLLTVPFAARWHFIPHDYWRYTPSSLKYLPEIPVGARWFREHRYNSARQFSHRCLLQSYGIDAAPAVSTGAFRRCSNAMGNAYTGCFADTTDDRAGGHR